MNENRRKQAKTLLNLRTLSDKELDELSYYRHPFQRWVPLESVEGSLKEAKEDEEKHILSEAMKQWQADVVIFRDKTNKTIKELEGKIEAYHQWLKLNKKAYSTDFGHGYYSAIQDCLEKLGVMTPTVNTEQKGEQKP